MAGAEQGWGERSPAAESGHRPLTLNDLVMAAGTGLRAGWQQMVETAGGPHQIGPAIESAFAGWLTERFGPWLVSTGASGSAARASAEAEVSTAEAITDQLASTAAEETGDGDVPGDAEATGHLGRTGEEDVVVDEQVVTEEAGDDVELTLLSDLATSPTAGAWMRPVDGGPRPSPTEAWRLFHTLCWRLPRREAARWRRQAGLPDDEADLVPVLDMSTAPVLIPSREDGEPLVLAERAELGPGDGWRPEWLGELAPVAEAVATAMTAIETVRRHDDRLRSVYRSDRFDRERDPITSETTADALLGAYRRFQESEPGSSAAFVALLDLDEVVHSYVSLPLPDQTSWLASIGTAVRRQLWILYGQRSSWDGELHPLSSGDDIANLVQRTLNVKATDGLPAGQVVWTVRLWSRVDGIVRPGRIICAV